MNKRMLWIPLGLMAVALLVWVGWLLTMVVNGILSVDDEREARQREIATLPAVEEVRSLDPPEAPAGGLRGHYTEWVLTPEAPAHADVLAPEIGLRAKDRHYVAWTIPAWEARFVSHSSRVEEPTAAWWLAFVERLHDADPEASSRCFGGHRTVCTVDAADAAAVRAALAEGFPAYDAWIQDGSQGDWLPRRLKVLVDGQEVLDLEDADHPARGSDEGMEPPAG